MDAKLRNSIFFQKIGLTDLDPSIAQASAAALVDSAADDDQAPTSDKIPGDTAEESSDTEALAACRT